MCIRDSDLHALSFQVLIRCASEWDDITPGLERQCEEANTIAAHAQARAQLTMARRARLEIAFANKQLWSSAPAPVHKRLQRFSDNSKLCGFPGREDKVIVPMMEPKARPGYFSYYIDMFGDFVKQVPKEQEDFLKNMDEFELRYAFNICHKRIFHT